MPYVIIGTRRGRRARNDRRSSLPTRPRRSHTIPVDRIATRNRTLPGREVVPRRADVARSVGRWNVRAAEECRMGGDRALVRARLDRKMDDSGGLRREVMTSTVASSASVGSGAGRRLDVPAVRVPRHLPRHTAVIVDSRLSCPAFRSKSRTLDEGTEMRQE